MSPVAIKKWIAESPTMLTTGPVRKSILLERKGIIEYYAGLYKIEAPRGRLSEPQKKQLRQLYNELNQLEIRAGVPISKVTKWPTGLVAKKAGSSGSRKKF